MQESEDRLFERWCLRGDAQALGELFDRAAPRLLRLAIHLAGDAVEAEDLVQATFLAAIEQRASVDASRPVMPWLTGVLAHKAQQFQRGAARTLDVERLVAREEADPSRPLERRDLDGEVARAIDRLAEPYRQVLVLRLRHGMEIGDMAHVLERAPGTVRVQLHRGLEKLRALLPATLASSLLLGLAAPRGLAAVKAEVLREAAKAAGATSTLTIGGWIVSKQVAAAAAAVVAIAALVFFQHPSREAAGRHELDEAHTSTDPDSTRPDRVEPVDTEPASTASESAHRIALEPPPAPDGTLRGLVVDAETSLPVAGASLRLFEPRRGHLLDLVRASPELYEVQGNGELRARTWGDWPLIVGSSPAARFGRETLTVYDRPRPGEEPIGESLSGRDGSFALACSRPGGVLECSHAGYETRWRPARDLGSATTIALWREREVHGVVVAGGQPVSEPIDLVLTAAGDPTEEQRQLHGAWAGDDVREAIGAWTARTGADGRFTVRVGARRVTVAITTSGWSTQMRATHEVTGEALTILAERMPAFRFFDAATKAPVERVRLLGREQTNLNVRWAGEFHAPGGVLTLPGDWHMVMWHRTSTLEFVAWTTGHAPASLLVSDVSTAGTIDVPLEAGAYPALDGVVRRGGEPVVGAEVALIGRSPLQWGVDEDWLVDAVKTSSEGRFRLEAPGGSYVLRVRTDDAPFVERVTFPDKPAFSVMRAVAGREPYFEQVDLPAQARLDVDLARANRIEVEIVDTLGVPRAQHVIALRGEDGRQSMAYTDERGRASFPNLPLGKFRLHTPHVSTTGSFGGGELREVELQLGQVEHVRIEIPAFTGPRHARVVARDVTDYSGWRARYDAGPWEELAVDGTVPMDLTTEAFELEIASPEKRHWHVSIPKSAPHGHVIELEAGTGLYRGELLQADGTPWPGVAVHACAWNACAPAVEARVSCVTDERGEFELAGLASCEYRLLFHSQAGWNPWDEYRNELAGMSFTPSAPPSESPEWLSIRVAEPTELVRIHGSVRRANGERLADARLVFECRVPTPGGSLQVAGKRAYTHANDRGEFELELPRAPELMVRVYTSWTAEGLALTQALEPARLESELVLVVP